MNMPTHIMAKPSQVAIGTFRSGKSGIDFCSGWVVVASATDVGHTCSIARYGAS